MMKIFPSLRHKPRTQLVRPIPLLGCTDRHQYSHELRVGPVCDANWVYRRHVRDAAASQSLRSPGFEDLGHPARRCLLEKINKLSEMIDSLDKPVTFQGDQQFFDCSRRIAKAFPLSL